MNTSSLVAPADYASLSDTLAFTPSSSLVQCVDISIVDDAENEGPETFLFVIDLSQSSGIMVVPPNNFSTITILDNDASMFILLQDKHKVIDNLANSCSSSWF